MTSDAKDLEMINKVGEGLLPGHLGFEVTHLDTGRVEARMELRKTHMAPNGYLHAASVIALADSACGFGAMRALPEGATSFTTIELKSNFLGTSREGTIETVATAVHLGRTTQLWDAEVKDAGTGKTIALFRCTQMVLWPKG